jgi:hypothetical protein
MKRVKNTAKIMSIGRARSGRFGTVGAWVTGIA